MCLNTRKMVFSSEFVTFWLKSYKFFILLPNHFLKVLHSRELVRLKDLSLKTISSTHMMGLELVEIFKTVENSEARKVRNFETHDTLSK
eukprot:UN23797